MNNNIKPIIASLSALLHDAATPRDGLTTDALVNALIQHYNSLYPEDAIDPTVTRTGSRRITSQTGYSDQLLRALKADPAGGAFLAMRLSALKQRRSGFSLPLWSASPDHQAACLDTFAELHRLISDIERAPEYRQFFQSMSDIHRAALAIQPTLADTISVEKLAEDYPFMAEMISGELSQCKSLTVQVNDPGEDASDVLSDQLNEWVIRVSNDKELLQASLNAPLGFTLFATILDNDPASSYFSLLCKTPTRSILYQDTLKVVYPGQHTRRRNDRAHERRIDASPFPYTLLALDITDNGRKIKPAEGSTMLTLSSERPVRILSSVRDMEPTELIQLLTCMRLIIADWSELQPARLAQPAQAMLSFQPTPQTLPIVINQAPIHLPWSIMTTHQLDVAQYAAAEQDAGNRAPERNWVAEQMLPGVLSMLDEQPLVQDHGTGLMVDTCFGTPTELSTEQGVKADLLFLVRCEQAHRIKAALPAWKEQELQRTREWLKTALLTSDRLLTDIVQAEQWGVDGGSPYHGKAFSGEVSLPDDAVAFYQAHRNLLGFASRYDPTGKDPLGSLVDATRQQCGYRHTAWLDDKKYQQGFLRTPETVFLSEGVCRPHTSLGHLPSENIRCAFSNDAAEFFFEIQFQGKFAVAEFTGTDWQSLPPLLRTLGDHPYLGNSILSRTDPLMNMRDWESVRPFTAVVGLSMPTLNALRAKAGLPALTKAAIKRLFKARRASAPTQ